MFVESDLWMSATLTEETSRSNDTREGTQAYQMFLPFLIFFFPFSLFFDFFMRIGYMWAVRLMDKAERGDKEQEGARNEPDLRYFDSFGSYYKKRAMKR